jgi:hypothetical protein
VDRISRGLLVGIAIGLVAVRPWRQGDRRLLVLTGVLLLATLVMAGLAAGLASLIRDYVDEHSPVENTTAALLVALPGVTGQIVTLGFATGFRQWRGMRRPTAFAAGLGALAALAVAGCLIYAYELFPLLDSEF